MNSVMQSLGANVVGGAGILTENLKDMTSFGIVKSDAVERNIEKIGEAAAAIPDNVREWHPEMPWKTIVGLRNKVIHHYFAVDHEVIWQIVTKNIPATKGKIAGILREYSR